MRILVSACLLGVNCKYNGGNNESRNLKDLMEKYTLIPVCPEQLGGMSTPRRPNEIVGGGGKSVLEGEARVQEIDGKDNTESFIKGAEEVLGIARKFNVKYAILKEKSPSCGSRGIYDGTFSGQLIEGKGVTAALLEKSGIKVYSEEKIDEFLQALEEEQ